MIKYLSTLVRIIFSLSFPRRSLSATCEWMNMVSAVLDFFYSRLSTCWCSHSFSWEGDTEYQPIILYYDAKHAKGLFIIWLIMIYKMMYHLPLIMTLWSSVRRFTSDFLKWHSHMEMINKSLHNWQKKVIIHFNPSITLSSKPFDGSRTRSTDIVKSSSPVVLAWANWYKIDTHQWISTADINFPPLCIQIVVCEKFYGIQCIQW